MVATEPTNSPTFDYPPMTVLPVVDNPSRFYVLGNHEWWYCVDLKTDSQPDCECKGHQFRGHCSHVDAVKQHLREQQPCPWCDGHAVTTTEYVEGRGWRVREQCAAGCGYRRSL